MNKMFPYSVKKEDKRMWVDKYQGKTPRQRKTSLMAVFLSAVCIVVLVSLSVIAFVDVAYVVKKSTKGQLIVVLGFLGCVALTFLRRKWNQLNNK